MIVVRMELWPSGDQSRAQDLGVAIIANEGESATDSNPPYSVRLLKSPKYSKSQEAVKDRLISLRAYLDRRAR